MHCARCGEEGREGDRFCRNCGADLDQTGDAAPQPAPLRERLARMAGRNRRERLLTIGTAIALLVAVAAFIALDTPDDADDDPYTAAADAICVEGKREIAAAGQRAFAATGAGPRDYAADLVRVTTVWRSQMADLAQAEAAPAEAADLDAALREVTVRAGELADAGRQGDGNLLELAARVDEASTGVETAIEELGLERCTELQLTSPAASP